MKISILIPALNEEAAIERSIRSAWNAGGDEIIVADGGSSDRTARIAKDLSCQVVFARRGRAAQQNAAAERATGDILLFLHADNWLAPEACDQIRQLAETDPLVCGAFRQRIEADRKIFRWIERGNGLRVQWLQLPYGDQGIFVSRELFEKVGGFADVRLLEDVLLMKQLRKHRRPILLDGPIFVSPRRWAKHGPIRQTLRNWMILAGYKLGVSPDRLAEFYRSK